MSFATVSMNSDLRSRAVSSIQLTCRQGHRPSPDETIITSWFTGPGGPSPDVPFAHLADGRWCGPVDVVIEVDAFHCPLHWTDAMGVLRLAPSGTHFTHDVSPDERCALPTPGSLF